MLALIDNYDSFTYNLYQYLCELGQEVEVVRNDKTTIEEIAGWQPERIIVSPGPCTPKEAGNFGGRDSSLWATASSAGGVLRVTSASGRLMVGLSGLRGRSCTASRR